MKLSDDQAIHDQAAMLCQQYDLEANRRTDRQFAVLMLLQFDSSFETADERVPDLEHHDYTATVSLAPAGRYNVRIAHAFVLRDRVGQGMPRPVFEEVASLP